MTFRALAAGAVATALPLLAISGCGSTPSSPATGGTHGTASVAYAGSLQLLATSVLGPKFEAATGDTFQGRGAGSTTLAQEILSNELSPGVFMSVGKKAIKMLWPDRSKFVIQLATDPLVVAYNPKSQYASQFAAIASAKQPIGRLFTLLATPGLRLGRTDPNADPQGVYFELMMELAPKVLGLSEDPAADVLGVSPAAPFGKPSQIVDETALVSDLQSGDFDATSAYLSQAIQYHLPYVALPASLDFADPSQSASYATVSLTLKNGTVDTGEPITLDETLVQPPTSGPAPSQADVAADDAFAAFMVSSTGRQILKAGGYDVVPPQFTGASRSDTPSSALPADVRSAFESSGGTTSAGTALGGAP